MRTPIAAFAMIFLCGGVFGPAAYAQSADHASCAPWKAKWAEVSGGTNLKAMDAVISNLPTLCPSLRSEAMTGRTAAANQAEEARAAAAQQQAALEAARKANDPCLQARSDWPYMQTASEVALRAYRDGLPAACGAWRAQADDRLVALESQRAAAEKADKDRREAERVNSMLAAAHAFGIVGMWESTGMYDDPSKCIWTDPAYERTQASAMLAFAFRVGLRIEGGYLVRDESKPNASNKSWRPGQSNRLAIVSADGNSIVAGEYTYTKSFDSRAGMILTEAGSTTKDQFHKCG